MAAVHFEASTVMALVPCLFVLSVCVGVSCLGPGPEVINLFFILNSAEHEFSPAHKCQNVNNIMINTASERLKARNFFICRYLF